MDNKITRRGFLATSVVGAASFMLSEKSALALDSNKSSKVSSTDTNEIKEVVSDFLEMYFSALSANGSCANVDRGLYNNERMYTVKVMNEWHKQSLESMGYTYEDINTIVKFDEIKKINSDRVSAVVDFLLVFRYSDIEPGGRTSRMRLDFQFDLLRTDNLEWKVYGIQTDYDVFNRFLCMVESIKKEGQAENETRRHADIAKERLLLDDADWFSTLIAQSAQSSEEITNAREEAQAKRGWCLYNPVYGLYYASWYATADLSDRIFYTVSASNGGDCTNFVSQCVWAAYGACNPNVAIMKYYRDNWLYMYYTNNYSTGWWGSTGGGCGSWEGVNSFWNIITAYNANAPAGVEIVSSTLVNSLSSSTINIIYEADVIQLGWYKNSIFDYRHSLFVDWNAKTGSTSGVYIDAHTTDRYFYKLSDVISALGGGSAVYLRDKGFLSTILTT